MINKLISTVNTDMALINCNKMPEQLEQLLGVNAKAPHESLTVKLVTQGVKSYSYNIVRYGDLYWAVHWSEGGFEIARFLAGEAYQPIIIGHSVEELIWGLDLLFSDKASSSAKQTDIFSYFRLVRKNLLNLRTDVLDCPPEEIACIPYYKNLLIPTGNLFERSAGKPITIISPAPVRTCNYRCEYCYHHDHGFNKNATAMESWMKAILTAVERIPRPLQLSAGAMGEPLFIPEWRETAYKILSHEHVTRLSFVSNLASSLDEFFNRVDPARIGMVASLHPSQFSNHDSDLNNFIEKVAWLKGLGVSIVVNYVLIPDQIPRFEEYHHKIKNIDVPMTINLLRGPYRGKLYPDAYTPEELATVNDFFTKLPFIYDYQSHNLNPYGGKCCSGCSGFYLEYDGTLYNCHFSFQRMGTIYDDSVMIRTENGYCMATKCECKTTIGWREEVSSVYDMQGSLQHFIKL